MSIIVEGPDGAGKTSLIRVLEQKLGLTVEPKVVNEDMTTTVDLKQWVEDDNNRDNDGRVLYDRHRLISECIYGAVFRPNTPSPGFDSYDWLAMELGIFYSRQPYIVYCLPPLETIQRNVWQDETNMTVRADIDQIYAHYRVRAAIDHYHTPISVWDYTKPETRDDILSSIIYFLKTGT